MTRKWLIAIVVVTVLVLVGVWVYTGWAADEVESDVAEDPVSYVTDAPPRAAA